MTGGSFKHLWRSNPDWYYFDEEGRIHLTDAAPEIAKESFKACIEWAKQREERRKAFYVKNDQESEEMA